MYTTKMRCPRWEDGARCRWFTAVAKFVQRSSVAILAATCNILSGDLQWNKRWWNNRGIMAPQDMAALHGAHGSPAWGMVPLPWGTWQPSMVHGTLAWGTWYPCHGALGSPIWGMVPLHEAHGTLACGTWQHCMGMAPLHISCWSLIISQGHDFMPSKYLSLRGKKLLGNQVDERGIKRMWGELRGQMNSEKE